MRSLMYTASIGRVTIRSICADRPTLVQTLNLLHIDQHTYPLPIHSTGPAQSQYKGWFPTCRMQRTHSRTRKMPKNAKHTSINRFYPRPCVRFLHYLCACVAYFGFLICVANPACIIGNQTLYCRSAGPVLWKGRGRVC